MNDRLTHNSEHSVPNPSRLAEFRTHPSLDKRDYELLYQLDINARQTHTQLAKTIGLSKQAVAARISNLERHRIINGYHPIIDHEALGYTSYRVYFKLRNATTTTTQSLLDYLQAHPLVWALVTESGLADIALAIHTRSSSEFHDFWDELHHQYAHLIKEQDISMYTRIHCFPCSYLSPKHTAPTIRTTGNREQAILDIHDLQLLKALSTNAKISLVELSQTIPLTPVALSQRLRRLERSVIAGYRANIDVSKLGYHFFKAELRLNDYSFTNKILHFAHQHPNIYQLDRIIGRSSLDIEIHAQTLHHFVSIMQELTDLYPEAVESYTYLQVLSFKKYTYL